MSSISKEIDGLMLRARETRQRAIDAAQSVYAETVKSIMTVAKLLDVDFAVDAETVAEVVKADVPAPTLTPTPHKRKGKNTNEVNLSWMIRAEVDKITGPFKPRHVARRIVTANAHMDYAQLRNVAGTMLPDMVAAGHLTKTTDGYYVPIGYTGTIPAEPEDEEDTKEEARQEAKKPAGEVGLPEAMKQELHTPPRRLMCKGCGEDSPDNDPTKRCPKCRSYHWEPIPAVLGKPILEVIA